MIQNSKFKGKYILFKSRIMFLKAENAVGYIDHYKMYKIIKCKA